MKPALLFIQPLNTKTNARIDVRVGDAGSAEYLGTGGQAWQPAMVGRPQLSTDLFNPDLNGTTLSGKMHVEINLKRMRGLPNHAFLYWSGAPVLLHSDGALEGPTAVPDFNGYVTGVSYDQTTGKLVLDCEVSLKLLDKPMLLKRFNGAGGLGGDAGKRGTYRPAGFGSVKNIEPIWFDAVRNIGQIDGYNNLTGISWCGEGLSSMGASFADYPNYIALAVAIDAGTVPNGRWATSIADGCIGLGAPPVGIITCHATFGYNRPGAWMVRILEQHAGILAAQIDLAAFALLDVAVNRATHFWIADQRNVKDMIEAISRSCNASPFVTWQGIVSVTRAVASAPVGIIDLTGAQAPRVLPNWKKGQPAAPVYRMTGRAARPARVLTDDQVFYVDKLIDRGLFSPAEVYRAGNEVWMPSGAQFLYINVTPAAGHIPPTATSPPAAPAADAWWQQKIPPTLAGDITYDDGTPIEALKPADASSTRNDDGANMIPAPQDATTWVFSSGGVYAHISNLRPAAANAAQLQANNAACAWSFPYTVPCNPGDVLYFTHTVLADVTATTGTDNIRGSYTCYDAAGASMGAVDMPDSAVFVSLGTGTWRLGMEKFTVPAGAAFIQVSSIRVATGPGLMYAGEPTLSRNEPGADVTATATILASLADFTILADSTGAITAGQLPATKAAIVTRGGIDIRINNITSYVISNTSGGVAGQVTVNNIPGDPAKGQVTIGAGMTGSGAFDLTVTVGGVAQPLKHVLVNQTNAAPPSGGGGGSTKSQSADCTGFGANNTYSAACSFMGMVLASGETMRGTAPLTYEFYATHSGTGFLSGKWQYATAGTGFASPTDFGSAITGGGSFFDADSFTSDPATGSFNQNATPAAGSYDIRLMLIRTGAAGASLYVTSGTAAMVLAP